MHKGERLILALPIALLRYYALRFVTVAVTLAVYSLVVPLGFV